MAEDTANSPPDSHIDHEAAINYWSSVTPDLNGILGGYPQLSQIDLRGSKSFLAKVRRSIPSMESKPLQLAVDCGAGIGRITDGFLSKQCDMVDVVEPVEKFAKVIRDGKLKQEGKIGDIYVVGLQDWVPTKKYDLIWNQWCLLHLTDAQLVEYLDRCRDALSDAGLIVVKENINSNPYEDFYDDTDSSVTRAEQNFRKLFARAGYEVVRSEEQLGFPKRLGLYPVMMYALRPKNE
ncbi:N-terminal protein methyltransferase [Coccidioides immitis RS]|uniref:Alpha N-terminal protein methyltransferase 1 n=4 Tax=Coccidioides immitis TaxID=5501 RepID=J3K6D7_COCIM|nr:N-terminal protein methyltransferase [Coccidioides immitis RS]KMP07072.1 hypothetical protein CIRG_06753 [Coccidioides immitis RMSCC 2394]KMU78959.1 hypothetical protein CISG_07602 [Coccidioides immitis RMSCC 3703]KMU86798.1 hypothetical protein CIHG_04587 [Coccidioides immitis H538.4]TPX22113.1 Alpha N-terminal protein methyltransferase 1 [Coccidioides immitis]EAS30123.3 hypothetical protein CIMG_08869 [Coccidioides immitis RS]